MSHFGSKEDENELVAFVAATSEKPFLSINFLHIENWRRSAF